MISLIKSTMVIVIEIIAIKYEICKWSREYKYREYVERERALDFILTNVLPFNIYIKFPQKWNQLRISDVLFYNTNVLYHNTS